MRFTPSANWTSIASGSNRVVTWTVSVKNTSTLNAALSAGTWVDVTSFIVELPSITQQIEYELGQFSSDSISFVGRNIDWWEANVFNMADYIELKITATLGRGSTVTSDTFYAFCGFVDKVGVSYDELADTVSFEAFTADELGNRISILNLNTQYFSTSIDGAGTDGLILPKIPGVFVKDAAISSYNLKKGLHTLEYDYNGGTEQMRLDTGDWVTLTLIDGTTTLINATGDQKIQLYIDVSRLSASQSTLTDYVIVLTAGTTLPRQPYYGITIRKMLSLLYAQIGIDTVTFDTLQLASAGSVEKFSFYDIPPQDISISGSIEAIENDGTNLFIGIGEYVYKRTMSTDVYSVVTSKNGYQVKRLWYNAANTDLWIWFDSGSTKYVRVYHVDSSTYDEVDIGNATRHTAADLYDGTAFYGLVYTENTNRSIRIVDDTATGSEILSATTMGYAASYGALATYLFVDGAKVYFRTIDAVNDFYHEIEEVAATWNDNGQVVTLSEVYATSYPAMLHASENRIYYIYLDAGDLKLKSHTTTSGTVTTIGTIGAASVFSADALTYANSKIYYMVRDDTASVSSSQLYSAASNAITQESTGEYNPFNQYFTMTYMSSVLYGVDQLRRLWRYSSTLQMYSFPSEFSEISIKDEIDSILKAYNLIGTISSHKKAFVYRRGDDNGDIQTTGNNFTLNNTNVVNITKLQKAFPIISLVEVTNGVTTVSYDGTNYDSGVFSDVRKISISNSHIPDNLVKDVCKNMYEFYSTGIDLYRIETNVPNMEYEVMDGASVTFSSTHIQLTDTGLIQSFGFDTNGNVNLEAIF